MVTFVTLFLGLVVGTHPVQLAVSGSVEVVLLQLDGETVATLSEEPWTVDTDLGAQLRPHELVAIALDASGQELGRSEQWINLPRSRAEARLALEVFEEGQARIARVIWHSIEGKGPTHVKVTFDGASLQAVGGDRFQIPAHDPEQLHVLSAELVFDGNLRSHVDVAVGGLMGERVTAEMTAVPLMRPRGADLPTVDAVQNRLLKAGGPLTVVATETGRSEVVGVVGHGAKLGLGTVGRKLDQSPPSVALADHRLQEGEQVRFVSPSPTRLTSRELPLDLFPISTPFVSDDGPISYLLSHVSMSTERTTQRLADSVAVAAVQAAGGNRPRVVLLILGGEEPDASRFSIDEVKSYLEALHVPLRVWTVGWGESRTISEGRRPLSVKTPWGKARDVSTVSRLLEAVTELRHTIDRQTIVWVEGRHLPQEIVLTEKFEPYTLAH